MPLAFWRRKANISRVPPDPFAPDTPLVDWSPKDTWTIRDAREGTFICGATGSGKTSTTISAITRAMCRIEGGGLLTTTKVDDAALYRRILKEEDRLDSLVPFDRTCQARLNILDYELNRPGEGSGHPDNIAQLLVKLVEMAGGTGPVTHGNDPYWSIKAVDMARHAVWLLWLARIPVTFLRLYLLITSAPRGSRDLKSKKWRIKSEFWRVFARAKRFSGTGPNAADFELSEEFWLLENAALHGRTRSSIVSHATLALGPFLRDPFRTLFSTTTNVCPEMAAEGLIFLLDFPVKVWNEAGRMAQALLKYAFQRAIERRTAESSPRPVFFIIDEYQHFCTESDIAFVATSRSAGVCNVFATQTLPALYASFAKLGGDGRNMTQALINNLGTKFFHAQTCQETNVMAADLCGKVRKRFSNGSVTLEPRPLFDLFRGAPPLNVGSSEQLVYDIEPHEFSRLPKGGPASHGAVGAVLFQNGREFSSGRAWLPILLNQGDFA